MNARIAAGLVRLMPARIGIHLVFAMAKRTQRPPVTPPQEAALKRATRLAYDNGKVAWCWGEGPLVILVHGWNGRAAQLAPLAESIAGRGFRCVAIEVTGHGSSPGSATAWSCFIDDIASLTSSLAQEVHAYVGHSAGGLAMMAARSLKGIRAGRYICICAPSHPFPPINMLRKRLDPQPAIIHLYQQYLASQFGTDWETLRTGSAFTNLDGDLLLVYDHADWFVPHAEGDFIHAACSRSRLVKTNAYGHLKILASDELMEIAGEFIQASDAWKKQPAALMHLDVSAAG